MASRVKLDPDKIGATASMVCAVHCLLTGIALGLLSILGVGFIGSWKVDAAFIGTAVVVGVWAVVHGHKKHHNIWPAVVFGIGLVSVLLGHLVFRDAEAARGMTFQKIFDTVFSVLGGLCLVSFHILNQRLGHSCTAACNCEVNTLDEFPIQEHSPIGFAERA